MLEEYQNYRITQQAISSAGVLLIRGDDSFISFWAALSVAGSWKNMNSTVISKKRNPTHIYI